MATARLQAAVSELGSVMGRQCKVAPLFVCVLLLVLLKPASAWADGDLIQKIRNLISDKNYHIDFRRCGGQCGPESRKLQTFLTENGIATDLHFSETGPHFYLTSGDTVIDPTIAQFLDDHRGIFVGSVTDLEEVFRSRGYRPDSLKSVGRIYGPDPLKTRVFRASLGRGLPQGKAAVKATAASSIDLMIPFQNEVQYRPIPRNRSLVLYRGNTRPPSSPSPPFTMEAPRVPASYAAAVAEASLESKGLFADASRFGRLLRSPGVRTTGKVLGTGATVIGYAGDAYNIGYVTYTYGQTTADTMRDVANTYQAVQENPGQTVLDQIVSSGLDNSGFYTTLSKNIHAGTLRRRDIHGGDRWAYNPWNWFFTSY